jgi:stage V sporulation protein AF
MEDLADPQEVEAIRRKLLSLDVEALPMGQESLAEVLIDSHWYNPFPKVRYTERPDSAAAMILEGSVIILCDNNPAAMILPTSIFDFLQDTDDFSFPPMVGGYLKIVRSSVYVLSLIATPLWYLLLKNPTLVPLSFQFFAEQGKSTVPVLLQLLLVEFGVDGLKLASLNTPEALNSSLGIIGGLILGEMAIKVGWLSAQVIFYMAFAAIANFTQPSYELGYAFKFMRILTLILIALWNGWGLLLGIFITFVLIATNQNVGQRSYLYPLIPFNRVAMRRLVLRSRLKNGQKQPLSRKYDKRH